MKSILAAAALAVVTSVTGGWANTLDPNALVIDFDNVANNGVTAYAYDQFFFYPVNFVSDTKCAPSSDGTPNGNCLQDEKQGLMTIMTRPSDPTTASYLETTLNAGGNPATKLATAFGTDIAPKDLGLQTYDLLAFYFVLVGGENADNNPNFVPAENYISVLDISNDFAAGSNPYLGYSASQPFDFNNVTGTDCGARNGDIGYLFYFGQTYDGSSAGCTPIVQNFNTGLVEPLAFNTPYVAYFTMGEFDGVKAVAWYASDEANTRLDCVSVRYPGSDNAGAICNPNEVPVPAAAWLLLGGLGGLGGLAGLKRRGKA